MVGSLRKSIVPAVQHGGDFLMHRVAICGDGILMRRRAVRDCWCVEFSLCYQFLCSTFVLFSLNAGGTDDEVVWVNPYAVYTVDPLTAAATYVMTLSEREIDYSELTLILSAVRQWHGW